MKTKIVILIIVLFAGDSCRKVCGCFLPPAPKSLNFEVLDKDGNSLVKSLSDSVSITYPDNNFSNKNITEKLTLRKLYTDFSDTTIRASYYNGIYITDFSRMCGLSSQNPPANNFHLKVNGVEVGVLVYSYTQFQATYPALSKAGLSFNDAPTIYMHGVTLLQVK
jgi:hypothetical protein